MCAGLPVGQTRDARARGITRTAIPWIILSLILIGGCSDSVKAIQSATVTQSQTKLPADSQPSAIPTETSKPSATATPAALLCSPLAVQPLERIAEIITQPFRMPRVVADGSYKDDGHHGLDLGYYTRDGVNFTGTPVLSALEGKIAAIIRDRPPYGNAVIVETLFERTPTHIIAAQPIPEDYSLYLLYAHLQNLRPLSVGQPVVCGEELAETGLTGFTGGPHLHLETRWGPPQESFESMAYYRADATPAELAAYERWRMSGTFVVFDPMILFSPATEN